MFAPLLDGVEQARYGLVRVRRAYVRVARGRVHLNGIPLGNGDAAKLEGEASITLDCGDVVEVLLFHLS